MKPKNILALIEHLESVPDRAFDLMTWFSPDPNGRYTEAPGDRALAQELIETQHRNKEEGHYCGTAACIAGHAQVLQLALTGFGDCLDPSTAAAHFLGLADHQTIQLFTPDEVDWYEIKERRAEGGDIHAYEVPSYRAVKVKQAVQVLQHLLKTGAVDWRVAEWDEQNAWARTEPNLATAVVADYDEWKQIRDRIDAGEVN